MPKTTTQGTKAQQTECKELASHMQKLRDKAGMPVDKVERFLKIGKNRWYAVTGKLAKGNGYYTLLPQAKKLATTLQNWVYGKQQAEIKAVSKIKAKAKATRSTRQQKKASFKTPERETFDWGNVSSDAMLKNLSAPTYTWSEADKKEMALELSKRMNQSRRSLPGFVVDLQESGLSSNLVGEERWEIPETHILLRANPNGSFSVYGVKAVAEDPRVRLAREECSTSLEKLNQKIEILEMELSQYRTWHGLLMKGPSMIQTQPIPNLSDMINSTENGNKDVELVHSD